MFRFGWALIALWAAPAAAQLIHLNTFIWDGTHPSVRGISGFQFTDNGTGYAAVSDFGEILVGSIIRSDGNITAMPVAQVARIKARSGRPTRGPEGDAESVAVQPNGEIAIGFERIHRIARFPDTFGPAINVGSMDDISGLVGNQGIEALATAPDGTLHAIPEAPFQGMHTIYAFRDARWHPVLQYPLKGSFMSVGADFGPNGDLWILERRFIPPFFSSRIRRVSMQDQRAVTIWQSALGAFDNLEAISVRQDEDGRTRITLVSDNNDKWYQQTQVVEFALQD